MGQGAAQRSSEPLRFEAEARELYAVLSDGHDGLGYHVSRGCSLRVADTGCLVLTSEVEPGDWRPARDVHPDGSMVDRRFNPFVLRQHLLGSYDVAIESPSWTSHLTFDIDRHLPGDEADELAVSGRVLAELNAQRDGVLAGLWRAFSLGPSRMPVIQKSPSGGYHVTLPIDRGGEGEYTERTWPAEWLREHVCEALWAAGLELKPGLLELFPSGTRLRAPCGRGQLLLRPRQPTCPDRLELEAVPGTWSSRADRARGEFVQVRRVAPMVRTYLRQMAETRRPLEAWLGGDEPLWHPVRGPFRAQKKRAESPGVSALSRHIGEGKLGALAAEPANTRDEQGSDWLLHGKAFLDRIRSLTQFGLTETGTRHDAVLKLVWYWAVRCGAARVEVERRLRTWLEEHAHRSNLLDKSPRAFVRQTMREALHYFDRHVMPSLAGKVHSRGMDVSLRPLLEADRAAVLSEVMPGVRLEAETILGRLRAASDAAGWVPGAALLSGRVLEGDNGDRRVSVEAGGVTRRRRAAVVAREELVRLGVLALHHDYSTGKHGRMYSCWYQFGSGVLPAVCRETGARVLARRTVPEGTVEIVAARAGEKFPSTRFRPKRAAPKSGAGRRWWIRLYDRRLYTPGDFFAADPARMLQARRRWVAPVAPTHEAIAAVTRPRATEPPREPAHAVRGSPLEHAMAAALSSWSVANDDRGPP